MKLFCGVFQPEISREILQVLYKSKDLNQSIKTICDDFPISEENLKNHIKSITDDLIKARIKLTLVLYIEAYSCVKKREYKGKWKESYYYENNDSCFQVFHKDLHGFDELFLKGFVTLKEIHLYFYNDKKSLNTTRSKHYLHKFYSDDLYITSYRGKLYCVLKNVSFDFEKTLSVLFNDSLPIVKKNTCIVPKNIKNTKEDDLIVNTKECLKKGLLHKGSMIYELFFCQTYNLLQENSRRFRFSDCIKLYSSTLLTRIGKSNYNNVLRGIGCNEEDYSVNCENFNILLPSVRTLQSLITQREILPGFHQEIFDQFFIEKEKNYVVIFIDCVDIIPGLHINHNSTKLFGLTEVVDISKISCLQVPLTKKDFAYKVCQLIGINFEGGKSIPLNYKFVSSEDNNVIFEFIKETVNHINTNTPYRVKMIVADGGLTKACQKLDDVLFASCITHLLKTYRNILINKVLYYPVNIINLLDDYINEYQNFEYKIDHCCNVIKIIISDFSSWELIEVQYKEETFEYQNKEVSYINCEKNTLFNCRFEEDDKELTISLYKGISEYLTGYLAITVEKTHHITVSTATFQEFNITTLKYLFHEKGLDKHLTKECLYINDKQNEKAAASLYKQNIIDFVGTIEGCEGLTKYLEIGCDIYWKAFEKESDINTALKGMRNVYVKYTEWNFWMEDFGAAFKQKHFLTKQMISKFKINMDTYEAIKEFIDKNCLKGEFPRISLV